MLNFKVLSGAGAEVRGAEYHIIMIYLEYVGLGVGIIYTVIAIALFRGLITEYRRTDKIPKISILIPARNEEQYLPACLESLSKSLFPVNQTEVIILNDRSEDRTAEIARAYCNMSSHFRLINIAEDVAGLAGKMNVLKQGIDIAAGEIILVTDADCEVSPEWAGALVSYFTEETGMVGGLTLLSKDRSDESLFAKVQSLDWLFLQAVAAGAAGSGFPTSILGNNFAFRKQAYLETGGYESIGFSLTEDMALMQAIRKLDKWGIKYPLSQQTEIYSQPAKSLSELYNQRRRWISGGMVGPVSGWIMMVSTFLAHFLPLILFFTTAPSWITGMTLLLPIVSDISFILSPLTKKIRRRDLLRYFTLFEVYYFLYTTFLAFLTLIPFKISWKNRRF